MYHYHQNNHHYHHVSGGTLHQQYHHHQDNNNNNNNTTVSDIQGLSERMSKVKCLWKSQFSQKISFLNCFRSEISGKFMPYSTQVHQNHPVASLEAGASDVLSGCDRLFEADHWPETLGKDPNHVFKFPRGKSVILTYLSPFTLLILSFTNWNTNIGSFLRVSGQCSASNSLSQPESTSEAPFSKDASGWFWWTWVL